MVREPLRGGWAERHVPAPGPEETREEAVEAPKPGIRTSAYRVAVKELKLRYRSMQ